MTTDRRTAIIEGLKEELSASEQELAQLETALAHIERAQDGAPASNGTPPVRRGRGRPKGSPNRPPEVRKAEKDGPKRGRGRPKGSKNKPKFVVVTPAQVSPIAPMSMDSTDVAPVVVEAPIDTPVVVEAVVEAPMVLSVVEPEQVYAPEPTTAESTAPSVPMGIQTRESVFDSQ